MKRFIQGFIAGICFVLLLLVLFVTVTPLMFRNAKLVQGYNKLEYGMSQTEVVALMGTEGTKSTELPLGDGYLKSRYQMEYSAMRRINAACFLSWTVDDVTFVVAFDEGNRVIYKGDFGT